MIKMYHALHIMNLFFSVFIFVCLLTLDNQKMCDYMYLFYFKVSSFKLSSWKKKCFIESRWNLCVDRREFLVSGEIKLEYIIDDKCLVVTYVLPT